MGNEAEMSQCQQPTNAFGTINRNMDVRDVCGVLPIYVVWLADGEECRVVISVNPMVYIVE